MSSRLRILELFSGIGGMHLALKESEINAEVVAAVDINTSANEVYKFNFPDTNLLQRNIEGFTAKEIEKLKPDMILMSPPCQPFSRTGKQQGLADTRCMALIHFMELLPELWGIRYVLLENVVGFEKSVAREELVHILQENLFQVQEFHLTPSQFHIPNSRSRYYLLAKKRPWTFSHTLSGLATKLPVAVKPELEKPAHPILSKLNSKHQELAGKDGCYLLSHILEQLDPSATVEHSVPDKVIERYIWEMDLVDSASNHSCCFTKAYRRFHLGTGSIVVNNTQKSASIFDTIERTSESKITPEDIVKVRSLSPRFFSPREILRLMCFPESFNFPSSMSARQASALLGNSINVHVVGLLIAYLTDGDLVIN